MNILKNFALISCLLSVLTVSGQSQNNADPVFSIKPQFSKAYPFSEGLATVRIGDFENGKCGYIDKTGQYLISPTFDECNSFSDGLAAVRLGDYRTGKWGYINKHGKFVITPQFIQSDFYATPANHFSQGLAAVRVGDHKTGKWGFINKKGDFVINPQFSYAYKFIEDLASVKVGGESGKYGFIDRNGKFVINPLYQDSRDFSEGLAGVNAGTKDRPDWIFINRYGEEVVKIPSTISSKYRWAMVDSFKEGVGKAYFVPIDDLNRNGIWKMINRKGQVLFSDELSISLSHSFSLGLAATYVGQYPNGAYGFFDKNGQMVIAPQFDSVDDFQNGFARFRIGSFESGVIGFINRRGKIVINPVFKSNFCCDVFSFSEGLAAVNVGTDKNGLWGYIRSPVDDE